ncbi:RcnB family protein [Martelella sp. HB161492]|uniref:RcnB family protein n=1 Tax=Martelella sp. HB161492 TaxID=2720726 RepID=UPI0015905798|nr:RcnB family protein [Martelella sp. HB161492]
MKKIIVTSVAAMALAFSPMAYAAGPGPDNCGPQKPGQPSHCGPSQGKGGQPGQPGNPGQSGGHQGQPGQPGNPGQPGGRQGQPGQPGGPQAHQGPQRGQKLPPDQRGQPIPPSAYNRNHLPPPPPGQQWYQVNGTFVLMTVATGLVMSILSGN